ncbi:hypothetical protein X975_19404, partial [Stegodyphus mimosarum]
MGYLYDKLTDVCLQLIVIISVLNMCFSTKFESVSEIESRPSFKHEVADFELWLKEKIKNGDIPSDDNLFQTGHQSSAEEPNYEDYHEPSSSEEVADDEMLDTLDFKKLLIETKDDSLSKVFPYKKKPSTSHENVFHENHSQDSKVQEETPFQELLEQLASEKEYPHEHASERSPVLPHINKRYPVEEILYIRRSDSELSDSVPDVIDALMPHETARQEKSESRHEEKSQSYSVHEDGLRRTGVDAFFKDTCSIYNHSFSDQQTCPSRLQYEIEPHFTKNYLDSLRSALERKQVKLHPEDSMCNYRKHLGLDRGVEERALCPFNWTLTDRNPARIPEYLLTAKCSCQISRKIKNKTAKCVEFKAKVPVLWRTDCKDGVHIYREGWEEIAVACVPLGRFVTFNKKADSVEIASKE